MSPEAEALLAELTEPGVICIDGVCSGVHGFLSGAGQLGEQVARWQRLLRIAEIAETDPGVCAGLNAVGQAAGALRRQATDLDRLLRELVATARQLDAAAAVLRTQLQSNQ